MKICGVDTQLSNCVAQQFLKKCHTSSREETFSATSRHLKNLTFINTDFQLPSPGPGIVKVSKSLWRIWFYKSVNYTVFCKYDCECS